MRSRSRQAEPFFYEPDHGQDGVRLLTSATSSKQAALRFGVTLAELRERGGRSADPDDTARTVAYPRTLLRSADNGNVYEIAATFPERQRTELVFTRLMPAEKAEIEDAASRFGMTVGTFSRAAQLSAARGERGLDALPVRSVRRPPVEKEMLAKVLGQLGKSGSNLNQLTALAHRQGLAPDVEAELSETLVEVRAVAQAVMQAMGRQT